MIDELMFVSRETDWPPPKASGQKGRAPGSDWGDGLKGDNPPSKGDADRSTHKDTETDVRDPAACDAPTLPATSLTLGGGGH